MIGKDENGKRRKTGGRAKVTLDKWTSAIREVMLAVFAELLARAGGANAYFVDWARDNSTDFYKLTSKLLQLQVTGEDGGPVITRIELVGVSPEPRTG